MSRDETNGRLEMQELTRRGFLWALSASGAMPAANPQSANPSPPPLRHDHLTDFGKLV